MSEFNTGKSPWSMDSDSNIGPSQQTYHISKEGSWRSFGSSMNAISFGLVATAILIFMFLIMATFEYLFKPNDESRQVQKQLESPKIVQPSYASDFPVVMPGQHNPTFIAQPAPLPDPLIDVVT